MKNNLYILFFLFLVYVSGFCQNLAVLNRKNIISMPLSVPYPFPTGYTRVDTMFNNPILLNIGVNLLGAAFIPFKSTYSTGIGLSTGMVFGKKSWKTSGSVGLGAYMQNNTSFNSIGFFSGISLRTGFYRLKWFGGAFISTGIPIISRIEFYLDEELINRVYGPYPIVGWYNPSSINYSYGFFVGYTIKQRSDIGVGYNQLINKVKNFGGYIIPSSFGLDRFSVGINYRFGKKSKIETKE